MASTTKIWSNNNPPTCEDDDLNGFKNENNNLIEASGQSLNTGDLQQTNKAVAQYSVDGESFTDGGAADAYTLSAPGLRAEPHALTDGMVLSFIPANVNTGASTVNPFGLGVKNIVMQGGGSIPAGAISGRTTLIYDASNDRFDLSSSQIIASASDKSHWPVLSNGSDTDHDIDFGVGYILDSAGSIFINLSSQLTKKLDAAYVAGDNVGGLFSGSIAADTSYHCFLIVNDSTGVVDAGFDTSPVAANIPSGNTAFRRIGSILTDASSNILQFEQRGDKFIYDTPVTDALNVSSATSASTLTLSVPGGIEMLAVVNVEQATSGGVFTYCSSLFSADIAPTSSGPFTLSTSSGYTGMHVALNIHTNTSSQIRRRSSAVEASAITVVTIGYIDDRTQ